MEQVFDRQCGSCYTLGIQSYMARCRMGAIRGGRSKQGPGWWLRGKYGRAVWSLMVGISRLCLPAARGVYHPQPHSRVVLGVALPPEADPDTVGARLWWRGLGLVERDGKLIAGADVSAAVQARRLRVARTFVTRQLRDAGVRGPVKRWEEPVR